MTGFIGILALGVVFLLFAIVEQKAKKVILTIVFSIIAVVGISLSIKDYYYITSDYLAINDAFSYTTKFYEWNDFERIEEITGTKNGVKEIEQIILHMKNGDTFTYHGGHMIMMIRKIVYNVEEAGGEYIRMSHPK